MNKSERQGAWAQGCNAVVSIGLGFIATLILGIVDFFIGPALSLSFLYLIPVVLVSWKATKAAVVCMATAAAFAWFFAEVMAGRIYANLFFSAWDAAARLCFMLTAGLLAWALRDARERERKAARIDTLTGMANIRAFREIAEAELRRAHRFHRPFTAVCLDFDNFKLVNSTGGREAGDRLLRETAAVLRESVRAVDLAARTGGDEFVLLFPETDPEQAKTVIGKIQNSISGIAEMQQLKITLSIGAATYFSPPSSVDEMLKDIDELIYAAKTSGNAQLRFDVIN